MTLTRPVCASAAIKLFNGHLSVAVCKQHSAAQHDTAQHTGAHQASKANRATSTTNPYLMLNAPGTIPLRCKHAGVLPGTGNLLEDCSMECSP